MFKLLKKVYVSFFLGILTTQAVESPTNNSIGQKGQWAFAFQSGWLPTHYASKGQLYRFNQNGPGFTTGESFKFNNQFKDPMLLGGELSYAFSDNIHGFVDINYMRARGNKFTFIYGNFNISQTFKDFKALGAYVGTRYAFAQLHPDFVPYVGAKVGVVRYSDVTAFEEFNNSTAPSKTIPFYDASTTVSGGAQLGCDYFIRRDFAIGIKAEVIASGARKSQVVRNAPPNAPNVYVGHTGTLISCPVQLVLRYRF